METVVAVAGVPVVCQIFREGVSLARKTGQIVRRGQRQWLVRVYLGRDRDRPVQRSPILPDLDEAVCLRLSHPVDLEPHVDALEPGRFAAANAGDRDLHPCQRHPRLPGVLFDQRHPAGGDAREKRLAVGQGFARPR